MGKEMDREELGMATKRPRQSEASLVPEGTRIKGSAPPARQVGSVPERRDPPTTGSPYTVPGTAVNGHNPPGRRAGICNDSLPRAQNF